MKIIIGEDSFSIAEHAKRTVKRIQNDPKDVSPRDVAFHQAKYPIECYECGETYWSKDQYGNHYGCKGPVERKEIGF